MTNRIVKTRYDDDSAVTILNPLSSEHSGKLIVIFEDAYGDFDMNMMTEEAVMMNHNITEKELEEFKNDEQS